MELPANLPEKNAGTRSKRSKQQPPEEGQLRVKRQRVSRACDQCRTGREKCDGVRPTCATCVTAKRECTYATNPKKRGIQPGYIRTLELCLSWLFSSNIGAEELLKKGLAVDDGLVQRLLSGRDITEADNLHTRWSKSIVCKQIEQLLSGAEIDSPDAAPDVAPDVHAASPSHPPPESSTSYGSAAPSGLLKSAAQHTSPIGPVHTGVPRVSSEIHTSQSGPTLASTPGRTGIGCDGKADQLLVLPRDHWKLLDFYYAFTHSWLPISEKHDILKTAYSYPPEGKTVEVDTPGSGIHAELWSILALSTYQAQSEHYHKDQILVQAQGLFPSDHGPFELGHVKGLLLLTLIYIGKQAWTPAWITVGRAIRIAMDLNIGTRKHSEMNHGGGSPRQKHVVLACFVIEATISICLTRPTHLSAQFIAGMGELDEDGLDEWSPWELPGTMLQGRPMDQHLPSRIPTRALSTFNQLVRVAMDSTHDRFSRSVGISTLSSKDSDTPQSVHLRIMTIFMTSSTENTAEPSVIDSVTGALDQYSRAYGLSTLPPTLVPFLARLTHTSDKTHPAFQRFFTLNRTLSKVWSKSETEPPALGENGIPSFGWQASPISLDRDHGVNPFPFTGRATNNPPTGSALDTYSGASPRHVLKQIPPQTSMGLGFTAQHGDGVYTNNTFGNMSASGPLSVGSMQSLHRETSQQLNPTISQSLSYQDDPNQGDNAVDLEAIFEEIAMLDASRQANERPQFMRNLGVAPDLDLSAFFGPDYQQSDPLLAYLQPDALDPSMNARNNNHSGS